VLASPCNDPTKTGPPSVDMIMSSISNAGLGTIKWWLKNGMPYTPVQMAAWAVQLSYAYLKLSLDLKDDFQPITGI